MNELDIFTEALARTDPTERTSFLDQACGGNPDLRRRLDELLVGHARRGNPLDHPPVGPAASATETFQSPQSIGDAPTLTHDGHSTPAGRSSTAELGTVIAGRYTLVEVIGEGGMGSVYLASQSEPVKRQVALKLIKSGMDSKTVLARFDAERQALALMDHPNIARIYDGGVTPAGQPFFVMELVKGVPLTDYCDQQRLSVDARLNLFVSVCQAVQHAHQKGIIHRDLKPGNILVTEVDGKPTPKVIDFGVAKATEIKLTDQSFADVGAIVGTPAYMSPEQANPSSMDIDTRTDVYALGVILYELLVGSPPIESKQFRRGAILEMLRMVREVEPPRPSTKLSTADALPNIAANRAIDPAKLAKLLRGELDWVVMKAIEKDRARRYETANGLARDIQRYLADEVVEARPPTRGYRLKKFVRRHKGQVIAASLVLFTLLGGIVGTSLALMEANRATDRERAARLEEERQRVFAEAISDFVEDDFLALTSVEGQERFGGEGKETLNKDMTLRDLLDRAAKKLKERKDLDPRIEAELCWIIGVSYRGAGEHEKAAEFLARAMQLGTEVLGRDHFFTMNAMNSLAVAYMSAGKHELALPLLEETVRLETAKYGADDPNTLLTTQNLASTCRKCGQTDRSLSLHEETLRRLKARLGPDHPLTLICMCNFGLSLSSAGQHDRALAILDEALVRAKAKDGPDSLQVAVCLHNYSEAYTATGQHTRALPLIEEAVKLRTAKLGREDYRTMDSLGELGTVLLELGKWQPAIALCEEVHQYTIAKLGAENPETFKTTNNLAVAYRNSGQTDRGLRMHEELLARMKARFGADHPETLLVMVNVGRGYLDSGKLEQAVPMLEEVLRLAGKLGPDHSTVALAKADLGHAYRDQGKQSQGLPLMEEGLRLQRIKPGPDHPVTLGTMNALAATYWQMKKLDKSIPLFEEALKGRRAKLGGDQFETLRTAGNLGINYLDAGRLAEAIPLLEEAHRAAARDERLKFVTPRLLQAYQNAQRLDLTIPILEVHVPQLKAQLGPDHRETLTNMNNLAAAYWSTKRLDKSIPLFEETLKLTVAKFGRENSETLQIVRNLGVNYRDAGRAAEAIPLLEECHRAAAKNPNLTRAGFDLIVAYAIAGEQSKLASMVEEVSAEIRKTQPQNLANLAGRYSEIGLGLLERKLWTAAEPVLRESLAIREKKEADLWSTFNVKSMIGESLLGQKRFGEAEPLLLAGYEGMLSRADEIPPQFRQQRFFEAVERLVRLYAAWDGAEPGRSNDAKSEAWKAKLPKEVAPLPHRPNE